MSQAAALPFQQQHAEHPLMWALRKGADLLLTPLKMLPGVGGFFRFLLQPLQDKESQQFQPTSPRGDDWAGSPEPESALARLYPQSQATQQLGEDGEQADKQTEKYGYDAAQRPQEPVAGPIKGLRIEALPREDQAHIFEIQSSSGSDR